MVVQIFNSGVISGPETLVLPALALFREPQAVVFLEEERLGERGRAPAAYARSLGLNVSTVTVRGRLDLRAIRTLRQKIRALGARTAHAHDVKATTYLWLASWGAPWRRVSTHHGVAGRPDRKTRWYEILYTRLVLPRMHKAITVSRADEDNLRRRGLGPGKLVYVANGVSRARWAPAERRAERDRLRERWAEMPGGLRADTSILGFVARLSAEKRHDYAFTALAELRRLRPELDWRLLIAGTGPLEAPLKATASALGIADRLWWLGYQANADALMPGLDLLLLTSSAEGLPIVAIEAGWAGTPVLASRVGDLPILLGEEAEAGGILFPPDQAPKQTAHEIAALLDRPGDRERMGLCLQGRVAQNFSAEAWVRRMEIVYDDPGATHQFP